MSTLLHIEWLKMRKYKAFWLIMAISALSYPGIIYIITNAFKGLTERSDQYSTYLKMAIGDPFSFPEVWHTVAYGSSLIVFIPAVVIIMMICNEYSFKTHRQNIIDGWSRSQFISAKMLDVFLISVLITLLYFIISITTGIANQERLIVDMWGQVHYTFLFALQIFAQLSIAFLIGFLVKKAFIALGIFVFYFLIVENALIYWAFEQKEFTHYFPLEISDRVIPPPAFMAKFDLASYNKSLADIDKHVLLTIILTSLVWGICYFINSRRDLK
jgi:ABC-2 type transport system permease protein